MYYIFLVFWLFHKEKLFINLIALTKFLLRQMPKINRAIGFIFAYKTLY